MAFDLDDFFDEFDELANLADSANADRLPQQLRRWFSAIDEGPLAVEVARLEATTSFANVQEVSMKEQSGIGSGTITWPEQRDERLGAQLALFRAIATEKLDLMNFSYGYFYVRNGDINDTVREMMSQLFPPFISELRRHLKRVGVEPSRRTEAAGIPASDRVVTLDHNSSQFDEVAAALEKAESALQQQNSGDPDEKEQRLAELSAGRRLLQASRIRVGVFASLVISALIWVATVFAETAAGQVAEYAIALIKPLLGLL